MKPFTSQAQRQLTGMTFHSTATHSRLKICPGLSAWGKAHLQAKTSWKLNTRRGLVISAPRLCGAKKAGVTKPPRGRLWHRSLWFHFSQGITLVLMEMKRRLLGAADPQGPKRGVGVGRAGEPPSPPTAPFLLAQAPHLIRCQPRPFLQGCL